jgi:hypothetical protein
VIQAATGILAMVHEMAIELGENRETDVAQHDAPVDRRRQLKQPVPTSETASLP